MIDKPHLISFRLCPYVQRCVITLLEKGIDYDVTYIELAEKPDWFVRLSPLGKVPVLRVGDEALFESSVINEYLNDVYPHSMHPRDPLLRAKNRAWIEFSGVVIDVTMKMIYTKATAELPAAIEQCQQRLLSVEEAITGEPYFNGAHFHLIDAAYAPAFLRIVAIEQYQSLKLLEQTPKLKAWSEAVLERRSVLDSVPTDFEHLLQQLLKERGSCLLT